MSKHLLVLAGCLRSLRIVGRGGRGARRGLASLGLGALCGLPGCGGGAEAVSTTAVEVARGDLHYEATYFGDLVTRESVVIHAPYTNRRGSLTVEDVLPDGTRVEEGDVVIEFDRGPLEDELRSAQVNLDLRVAQSKRTRFELEQSRVNLELDVERKRMALEKARLYVVEGVGIVSALDLEKYKLDVSKAELELSLATQALEAFGDQSQATLQVATLEEAEARAKVKEARADLEQLQVKAPASGVIFGPYTRLNWVRGKVMAGSVCRSGDKLLEIPDMSRFDLKIYVRQRDASLIEPGARAAVQPTVDPEVEIGATVVRKDPFATTRNERLGTESPEGTLKEIEVVLELDEVVPELRPGGTARVDLSAMLATNVVSVPLAALHQRGAGAQVVLASGEVRSVELGRVSHSFAEVVSGLEGGEQVRLPFPVEHKGSGPSMDRMEPPPAPTQDPAPVEVDPSPAPVVDSPRFRGPPGGRPGGRPGGGSGWSGHGKDGKRGGGRPGARPSGKPGGRPGGKPAAADKP